MSLDEGISTFIGRIYESADDEQAWERLVFDLLALTSCRFAFVATVDAGRGDYEATRWYGPSDSSIQRGISEYETEYYLADPSLRFAVENPTARFCDTRKLIPESEYLKHPYIRWNRSRFGSTHWLIGYTTSNDGLSFGVSLHPPESVGPMPAEKERLFRLLFEHMERAVRLAARPLRVDDGGEALVFLARDGRVLECTEKARDYLNQCDGLQICDGYLETPNPADRARLNSAISSALSALATGGAGGVVRLPRLSGKGEWVLSVTPLIASDRPLLAFRPRAVVRVMNCGRQIITSLHRRLFGLTQREAEVADLLLAGYSVEEAAAHLNMSRDTARVHIKALFKKTGAKRQPDLVRLLLSIR